LEEGPLVGTLPQELSSLQLTGEPVMVQRKKKPSGAQRKRLRKQKKQLLPNRLMEDRELEAPTAANSALVGLLMSALRAAVAQKTAVTRWDTSGCPEPGE